MRAYLELTKPRITWLILMSTGVGFYFGASGGWAWWTILHTLLGTGLLASGTAALNQWYEREADCKMKRTEQRPLPSGRLTPRRAFAWGVLLSVAGFAELALAVNMLSAALGLFTLLSYLLLYTPLKKVSPHATTVGAVPGAMPPLIGYAAASGVLTTEAWILAAILFLWQFPHFYSIAWLYRDDYARARIRMRPVVEPDGESTARHIVATSIMLVPVSLLPTLAGMTGAIYAAGATLLGIYFLRSGMRVASERSLVRARGVLLASVVYLPLLYGLMVLDRPPL